MNFNGRTTYWSVLAWFSRSLKWFCGSVRRDLCQDNYADDGDGDNLWWRGVYWFFQIVINGTQNSQYELCAFISTWICNSTGKKYQAKGDFDALGQNCNRKVDKSSILFKNLMSDLYVDPLSAIWCLGQISLERIRPIVGSW